MASGHEFCRAYLARVMKEVNASPVPKEEIRKAWAYKGSNYTEFHGPHGFYHHGRRCCAWMAKADGWAEYLEQIKEGKSNGSE